MPADARRSAEETNIPIRTPHPEILRRLKERADPSGFVSFDVVSEVALYAPDVGYYANPERELGKRGDFYTAPHVGPLFGATVARRIQSEYETLGRPERFTIAEMGPGDGTLAGDIASALPKRSLAGRWNYVLVEASAPLRDRAFNRVKKQHTSDGVRFRTAGSLSQLGTFEGIVLGNEFLDALPFRRLIRRDNGWHEMGMRIRDARLTTGEKFPPSKVPTRPLPENAEPGTILEIGAVAEAFIREVSDELGAGSAVFLDYGAEEAELVQSHPRGTLTAFRAHKVVDDPLESLGETDLSAFVNFSRVRSAAASAGLREQGFRSQAEALGAWGFEDVLRSAVAEAKSPEEEVKIRLAAKNLLFGFDRFRVLELSSGR